MDGINEKEQNKGISSPLAGGLPRHSRTDNILNAAVALCALLLARCHIVFGAHPAAIAFLAVLPCRVWYALAGAVIGSLTLGKAGIIYSMIAVIVVFLRVIISGGERTEEGVGRQPFSERILLRICTSVIGGFIITVYELLLSGFTKTSVLFGLSMILIPPALTFLLCGLFDSGITPSALLGKGSSIFTCADSTRRMTLIFFRISAATLILIISLSLSDLELLGISAAYIFAAFTTLTVSKRFGALHGAVAGFASALGLSPLYAASYALAGIAAGLLFRLGVTYALVGACTVMSLWSTYTSGLTGLLSTLPEYVIGATVAFPLLKKLPTEHSEEIRGTEKTAQDMVGTMALAFQNRYTGSLDALESSLSELSSVIAAFARSGRIRAEEYRDMIIGEVGRFLRGGEDSDKIITNASELAQRLERRERLTAADVAAQGVPCEVAAEIADSLNRRASAMEEERYRLCETVAAAEDYSAISRMISEARMHDEAERAMDTALSEKLGEVFRDCGFHDGTIRAFGERKKHVICAGEDEDGSRITAPELMAGIERVTGVRMGTPEYFRRGRLVLMECTAVPSYMCEHATASVAGSEREISGDTALCLTCADGRFISLISDGMGSGEIAMQTSSFVADFLRGMLFRGYSKDTVLHVLNGLVRAGGAECSATVDLFELDLINAEAQFIKSGAAASYVKRESSIFRIRSRTAPIGLMKAVDAERIRVEIKSGDYVIMLSDGVNQSPEEAPWLIELLSKPPKRNLQEYADSILAAAIRNNPPRDDMTVTVVRVSACA